MRKDLEHSCVDEDAHGPLVMVPQIFCGAVSSFKDVSGTLRGKGDRRKNCS